MYSYAFIGAGPATLAALIELPSDIRRSAVVLEAGRGKRRTCPSLKTNSCQSCFGDLCHVVNGVGGSSAMFGNKSCYFPASSVISSFFGEASDAKNPFDPVRSDMEKTVLSHPNVPNRKVYEASISMADQYRDAMATLVGKAMEATEFLEQWQVEEIAKLKNGSFRITSSTGAKVEARNVVIATGRGGYLSIRKWLDRLGVDFVEQSPDIGIRLEAPSEAFSDRFLYQTDPKFKFDFGELGTARTFCTCQGGSIVPVKFGRGVFADGAFLRKDTGRTNTAIMVRTGEIYSASQLEFWCESANSNTQGHLLLGEVSGNSQQSCQLVAGILEAVPEGPSKKFKKALRVALNELLTNETCKIFDGDLQDIGPLKVYGPSIDLYWPKVEIRHGFKTSIEGVFVIGDATGVSRGIFQAAMSGRGWAHSLNKERFRDAGGW